MSAGFHMKQKSWVPVILVAIAATIWGMDSTARLPASMKADPRLIVLLEHCIGLLVIAPFAFGRHRAELRKIRLADALPLMVLGIAGSSLGGMLFTRSVRQIGPSSAMLLQMIQPVFVVALAHAFLRERGSAKFFQCAIWVGFNYFLLSLAGQASPEAFVENGTGGAGLGLLAVLMWALSTVAGKKLLFKFSPAVVVLMRYSIATVFMGALVWADADALSWRQLLRADVFLPCLYLGTVGGAISLLIYYVGLRRLPASLVTFIELLFPVGGAMISLFSAGAQLSALQAIALLSLALVLVFLVGSEHAEALPEPQPRGA